MGPVLLALAVVAIVIAAPFASRRLRRGRVAPPDGEAAPSRKAGPAGRAAVLRPEVQPSGEEREPFAYDSGLMIGEKS
jgi:hypothetical protein